MQIFTSKENIKLVKFLTKNIKDLPFSKLQKLLRKKDVKVNGKRVNSDVMLSIGDEVIVYAQMDNLQKNSNVTIIYEDENILIIDKKDGVESEKLYDTLCVERDEELFFIHRLDRNTQGLICFAKNPDANEELLDAFKNGTVTKKYLARVCGIVKSDHEILKAYLFKDERLAKVIITPSMKIGSVEIITEYKVLERRADNTSILEVTLHTGKTHQIRAHLAFIGHAIVGDGKYGENLINEKFKVQTQQLIAQKLKFDFTSERMKYLNDINLITKISQY